jgi:glycosyltransferase involved in cell wall biosynthesis
VTPGQFYPKDKTECRKALGLLPDDFIVFNGNRNQFRKRIDITIQGFAKFAVGRPDTKLYLHMGLKDQGWDIMQIFAREMQRVGLDPNNRIIMTTQTEGPPNVEVDMLNTIYNAVDVGVNTCKGEGWGLVNFEHAACKVAQVVPDHTSCKEIFDGYGALIRCDHIDCDTNYGREMPCPSSDHLAEILEQLYELPDVRKQIGERCYERVTDSQFSWETVASQFGGIFEDVLRQGEGEVSSETPKPKKSRKERGKRVLAGSAT